MKNRSRSKERGKYHTIKSRRRYSRSRSQSKERHVPKKKRSPSKSRSSSSSRSRSVSRNRGSRRSPPPQKNRPSIFERIQKSTRTEEDQLKDLKSSINFLLEENAPRQKYSRTQAWEKKKNIIHWGQRKLFMSELWFLTTYGDLSKNVVYAGSAPGTHIPFLAFLFPEHKFYLIDPSEFRLKPGLGDDVYSRIIVRNDYFTDELALQYANELPDLLFISDIRTADPNEQDNETVELMVRNDNTKQKDWINIMKPKKSLLKFRCPYPDRALGKENLSMFAGEIYLQPYSAPTSTETRLVPYDSLLEIQYDNVKYEEQLYFHNHHIRKETYPQPIPDGEGFDQSWDISVEIVLLYDYLQKFPTFYSEESTLFEKIKRLSKEISRKIGARNLETPMKPPEQRRHFAHKDHTAFYPGLMENVQTKLLNIQTDPLINSKS